MPPSLRTTLPLHTTPPLQTWPTTNIAPTPLSLPTQEVPLFGHLMLGGSPQHTAERRWLLQLLLGGLRGPEDARAYRRRYVLELAMSLHDASGGPMWLVHRLWPECAWVP